MYFYLDLYKEFVCSASNCNSNCCMAGWNITLDEAVVKRFQILKGEFGDFFRRNTIENRENNTTSVKLTEDNICPFLTENKLCRIYLECGEEYMSEVCKLFPRALLNPGNAVMWSLSASCEEVLRLLYIKSEPLYLCTDENINIFTKDDMAVNMLSQFMSWGMELIQNETVPLSVSLSTAIYVGLEFGKYYGKKDIVNLEATLLSAPQIQEQFALSREELKSDVSEEAWKLIFGVVDTFCQLINESTISDTASFLWDAEMFKKTDNERKQYLLNCYGNQTKSEEQDRFIRRLSALYFQHHSMRLGYEPETSIYLRDVCNYLILMKILPLTWPEEYSPGKIQYFSRLSYISRVFEQSGLVKKYIGPVIQSLFSPDVFTYSTAFIELF